MKKTEDDIHRWKDIPQSWIWRINFDYPIQGYLQITNGIFFFNRTTTKILKVVWRHKRPQIAKAILRKKERAGGIRLPDFRLQYKASHVLAQ